MRRPEQEFQIRLVSELRWRILKPWIFWHTPNQGERPTQRMHGIRKAMGVRAGIPDLFVLGPNARLIGIECKAPARQPKSRIRVSRSKPVLSEAQKDTIALLGELGVPTIVVRDIDEAVAALSALGVAFRGRAM